MTKLNVSVYALTSRCPLLSVDGALEFSTRVPLPEQIRPGDISYVTRVGDQLPLLAFKFYRDVRLWWVIYDNNASKLLGNPFDVPADIVLRIPSKQVLEMELLSGGQV